MPTLRAFAFGSWLFTVLLISACDGGSDPGDAGPLDAARRDGGRADGGGADDGGATDGGPLDAGTVEDAGLADAGGDAAVGDAAVGDAGIDAGSATAPDAGAVDLGPVACRSGGECLTGICDVDAPGGRCQECTTADTCASSQECFFGACLLPCGDDADCNAGMRCGIIGGNLYCRPRDCASCPTPYVCREGQCARPRCADGPCPAGWSCAGTVCVEPG